MITKEQFTELINTVLSFNKELDRWDDFGIDLFNFDDEGIDWINWWLYEKPALFKGEADNQAYDENNKVIPTDTIDDLWNIVEKYRK